MASLAKGARAGIGAGRGVYPMGWRRSPVCIIGSMKQMALALARPPAPDFDSFAPGRNAEALAVLRAIGAVPAAERLLYLWGESGSGKTHLLHAAAHAASRRVAWFPVQPGEIGDALVLVDDVHRLDAGAQRLLFSVYNDVRDGGACLLVAGDAPPPGLALREDLVTRLSWGLVLQVHALTDDEKVAALEQHARGRGLRLPVEVSAYLLRHGRRDLPSLIGVLDALDRHCLETRRPVTLPLLREVLQTRLSLEDGPDSQPTRGSR